MSSDELVDRAAEALADNVNRLARRLRQRPLSGQLTQSEVAALARLTRNASVTVADLARAEKVRPQSMGAVVDSLEGRGLLKRQRDRADGRRVLLTVTRVGRETAERGRTPRTDQLAAGLSSGFSEEELEQIVAVAPLLGRLAARLSLD
jgi:DNA-binding MarR family transcriptional regulator